MIIEVKNSKEVKSLRDTNHFDESNGVFEYFKDKPL
jgi:hypothetical protein